MVARQLATAPDITVSSDSVRYGWEKKEEKEREKIFLGNSFPFGKENLSKTTLPQDFLLHLFE